jgi:hypothetical protein
MGGGAFVETFASFGQVRLYVNVTAGSTSVLGAPGQASAIAAAEITSGSDPWMRVTNDYHPTLDPNVFADTVTLTYRGKTASGPLVFQRGADWVLDPSPGSAYVSMHAAADGSVRFTGDQLRPSEPPFNPPATSTGKTGTFTDDRPGNRGTVIDLKIGSLNPGQTATLTFYFGAASSAAAAQASIAGIGMPTWAVGWCAACWWAPPRWRRWPGPRRANPDRT